MARLIRKCTQCGAEDSSKSWASTDEAAKQGALEQNWTCPACAWTEFELEEAGERPAPTGSAADSAAD